MQNSILIVGLGNPEDQHKYNRHNIGFILLDVYSSFRKFDNAILKTPNGKINIKQKIVFDHPVILLKPQDYMNLSGVATGFAVKGLQIDNKDILVIHDDMDFDFGTYKIKSGGGSGHHKGVQNIIDKIGSDFGRCRVGISRPRKGQAAIDYVLEDFALQEKKSFCELGSLTIDVVDDFVRYGISATMNKYNKKQ